MTKRSVKKRKVTIRPDGSCQTVHLSASFWDDENIRYDIDTERVIYASHPGVQAIEEAEAEHVLTVLYASGTVRVLTYSDH